MRHVQILVPPGWEEEVIDLLERENVEYMVTGEDSAREFEQVVTFTIPQSRVEEILDAVRGAVPDEEVHTVVMDAEVVLSDSLQPPPEETEETSIEDETIARQELLAHATDMTPSFDIYLTLTVVSALVATAGLLLDSPAVVVGSMVIAPLIGPALGASIGTILGEDDLTRSGIVYQLSGVVVAIVAAAAFAAMVRYANVVPPGFDITAVDEIRERLAPTILALVIALGAGVAGILSVVAGVSVTLVGVMIAAALIPPAAVAGVAIAFGHPYAALGAIVLVFVNLLSVNLSGLLTLWFAGYRPELIFDREPARRRLTRQVALLSLIVLVFSVFLVWITYTSFVAGTFEDDSEAAVEHVLSDEYEDYELVDLTVDPTATYPYLDPDRVTIVLAGPPGDLPPGLLTALDSTIETATDEDVTVDVQLLVSSEPEDHPDGSALEGETR